MPMQQRVVCSVIVRPKIEQGSASRTDKGTGNRRAELPHSRVRDYY